MKLQKMAKKLYRLVDILIVVLLYYVVCNNAEKSYQASNNLNIKMNRKIRKFTFSAIDC